MKSIKNDSEDISQNTQIENEKTINKRASKKLKLDFRKYTKQIWLAGLGAFSRAEEEGNKLFDSLVQVGEELELKTSESTGNTAEDTSLKAKESVFETKDKFERLLDQSIHHSLNKIGLVSIKDLHHLEKIVLELSNKVDSLLEENKEIKRLITEK